MNPPPPTIPPAPPSPPAPPAPPSPLQSLSLEAAIQKVFSCPLDVYCPREEACFTIANWVRNQQQQEQTLQPASGGADANDPDEVQYYAPDWRAT